MVVPAFGCWRLRAGEVIGHAAQMGAPAVCRCCGSRARLAVLLPAVLVAAGGVFWRVLLDSGRADMA